MNIRWTIALGAALVSLAGHHGTFTLTEQPPA